MRLRSMQFMSDDQTSPLQKSGRERQKFEADSLSILSFTAQIDRVTAQLF